MEPLDSNISTINSIWNFAYSRQWFRSN